MRTGWVVGVFDSPVLAVEEFQNWRNGVLANGASVNATGISYAFQTYADNYTGIAVANPICKHNFMFRDISGRSRKHTWEVTPLRFQVSGKRRLRLEAYSTYPPAAPGSYFLNCQNNAPFAALAIAGDSHGITSSMPPGNYALPSDQLRMIWNTFYQLVKVLNSDPEFSSRPTQSANLE